MRAYLLTVFVLLVCIYCLADALRRKEQVEWREIQHAMCPDNQEIQPTLCCGLHVCSA